MSGSRPPANDAPNALPADEAAHWVTTTASRRLRRSEDFRSAAAFMLGGGFHPRTNSLTQRLVELFATRMQQSKNGTFPLNVVKTCRQLGIQQRALYNHCRYLRELGLIAWQERGKKNANSRRARLGECYQPSDGFARTGTIFGACAPPAWDAAMGRRLAGTGYEARVIGFTEAGRAAEVREVRRRAARRRTAAPRRRACTPSVGPTGPQANLQSKGGINYTSRRREDATTPAPAPSAQQHSGPARARVSPGDCAAGVRVAQHLQRLVWWTARACPRRLAFALRPLITSGWNAEGLAHELLTWGVPRALKDPAGYTAHELRRRLRSGELIEPQLQRLNCAPDHLVDDEGARHARLPDRWKDTFEPAWQRTATLRSQLRHKIARTQTTYAPQKARRCPELREPQDHFEAEILAPSRVAPLEVYRWHAAGHAAPLPLLPRTTPLDQDRELAAYAALHDTAQAVRACDELRRRLESEAGPARNSPG
jgi:hypothetical protein